METPGIFSHYGYESASAGLGRNELPSLLNPPEHSAHRFASSSPGRARLRLHGSINHAVA